MLVDRDEVAVPVDVNISDEVVILCAKEVVVVDAVRVWRAQMCQSQNVYTNHR